jgi:tetratricopeptide (TPR) repeat protein
MAYGNRGGYICAGLLVCAATTFAQTNQTARSRDDKSAIVNLAVQAVQQVQAQQQTNLRAVNDTRQEVASLRRLTLVMGAVLGAGMLVLAWYARALLRANRPRRSPLLPHIGADTLLRRAAAFEQAHQPKEALACYEQVLALDTSLTEAYIGKGRVLNQLERYREALDCFEQAGHVSQG